MSRALQRGTRVGRGERRAAAQPAHHLRPTHPAPRCPARTTAAAITFGWTLQRCASSQGAGPKGACMRTRRCLAGEQAQQRPARGAHPTPPPPPLPQCIRDEGADDPPKCKPFADDYLECLHHRKYVRCAARCSPVVGGWEHARAVGPSPRRRTPSRRQRAGRLRAAAASGARQRGVPDLPFPHPRPLSPPPPTSAPAHSTSASCRSRPRSGGRRLRRQARAATTRRPATARHPRACAAPPRPMAAAGTRLDFPAPWP